MSPARIYPSAWDPRPLSRLNLVTTERYVDCLQRGAHHPGEEITLSRPLGAGYGELPICPSCKVPWVAKTATWNQGIV